MTARDVRAMSARNGPNSAVLGALVFAVLSVLPPFLTGAFSVGIRADIGFGTGALGGAIGLYFLSSSLLSVLSGATVERLGPRIGLALGGTLSAMSLTTIALARVYPALLIAMVLGGASNSITQPAVGALLSRRIPAGRLGLAFGIKQAGIPGATLLGGILVPTLAASLGWRTAMLMLAVSGLLCAGAVLRTPADDQGVVRRRMRARSMDEFRSLAILSAGGALGMGAATSFGAFLVASSVSTGFSEAAAGLLLAGGSLAGLIARVLLGWSADLRPTRSRYGATVALALLGVPGYLLFALEIPAAYVVGTFVVFVFGWSWAGLFQYAVVSQNPATPALATGVLQTGMSMGAGSGPLLFGLVAEFGGYRSAWIAAAGVALLSAGTVQIGRLHLRRTRARNSEAYLSELEPHQLDSDIGFEVVATGVEVRTFRTVNLDVTLMRISPDGTYTPPVPSRTGTLLNLGDHDVMLELNGEQQMCAPGMYRVAPAFRRWRVSNPGPSAVRVVRVEHLTSGTVHRHPA